VKQITHAPAHLALQPDPVVLRALRMDALTNRRDQPGVASKVVALSFLLTVRLTRDKTGSTRQA
jgi:hypothetical protein